MSQLEKEKETITLNVQLGRYQSKYGYSGWEYEHAKLKLDQETVCNLMNFWEQQQRQSVKNKNDNSDDSCYVLIMY